MRLSRFVHILLTDRKLPVDYPDNKFETFFVKKFCWKNKIFFNLVAAKILKKMFCWNFQEENFLAKRANQEEKIFHHLVKEYDDMFWAFYF